MAGSIIWIEGGGEQSFRCAADDTVLAGALRSGLGFPYECNSGGCGSCQFELVEGELRDLWPDAPGISDRQRGRGRRLACQSIADADCTIRIAIDPAKAPPVRPVRRTVTFTGKRELTADMAEFHFRGEGAAEFRPGQFAMLLLPGLDGPRAYSMSNLANGEGEWRFVVRRLPSGRATGFLFDEMRAGQKLVIDGPYGNSYLRTDGGRDVVCIAGGSGLSPVLSILQGVIETPALDHCGVTLFHGGRGPADMCAAAELGRHPGLRGRVQLHTAISDDQAPGAAGWSGERGMIHELVRRVLGERMAACDYYFCGPPAMTDAVHRMLLLEAKVPASQLHFDRFY
jgi:toluene monooxygenase electron transfer component